MRDSPEEDMPPVKAPRTRSRGDAGGDQRRVPYPDPSRGPSCWAVMSVGRSCLSAIPAPDQVEQATLHQGHTGCPWELGRPPLEVLTVTEPWLVSWETQGACHTGSWRRGEGGEGGSRERLVTRFLGASPPAGPGYTPAVSPFGAAWRVTTPCCPIASSPPPCRPSPQAGPVTVLTP